MIHTENYMWIEMLTGSFICMNDAAGVLPMKDGRWYAYCGSSRRIVESAAEGMGWVDSIGAKLRRLHAEINDDKQFVSVSTWTVTRTPAAPDADTKEHPMAKSKSVKGKAAKPSPAKSKSPAKKSGRGR